MISILGRIRSIVSSRFVRLEARFGRRQIFWGVYGTLIILVALGGGLAGMVFGYALELPQVEELEDIRPSVATNVYAVDGRLLGQFALENRILVRYEDIPDTIKHAVLAVEDARFFEHAGIDFRSAFARLFNDLIHWERKGASTITMQLSKLRFTYYEPTWGRKLLDGLHAIEIEKRYSKEQILTFYFNQVWMGHGIYGIATAADFYFSKRLDELNLNEAATLAGIIRWPPGYSPINSPERSKQRRNLVLHRMLDERYIDQATYDASIGEDVIVNTRKQGPGAAPYVLEAVRQDLAKDYDTDEIWNRGLQIHTTIDYDLQVAATAALRQGLEQFDKETRPWEGAPENILKQGRDMGKYYHPEWRQIFYPGMMVHGLVKESTDEAARVRIGSYEAVIQPEDIEWTKKKSVSAALKPGDVATFTIQSIDRVERLIDAKLDRIPDVQGAFIAIDNRTGAVLAMVGGFDYQYSEFNRATQALRQPGSVFKPFTYVAAMEQGFSPFDTELDEPVNFFDGLGRLYAPENSDEQFKGRLPLYQALAESRNVPTLRLANRIGIENVVKVAKRFGIDHNLPPYLPVAIGAGELTLQEICSAFTTFANQGVRASPYLIERVEDYDRTLLREHHNQVSEVISREIAAKMLYLLKGVVEQPLGTARRARVLGRSLAGKTGTTNDYTDSWFIGVVPSFTSGVWVGHETKKTLGEKVYGNTLALPIWIDFFQRISDKVPVEQFEDVYSPTADEERRVADLSEEQRLRDEEREASEISKSPAVKVEDIPAKPGPPPDR